MKFWRAVAVLIAHGPLCAQIPGPFELPERFHRYRFPQGPVADCSLPLPPPKNPAIKSYTVGQMTVRIGTHLRVEGKDVGGVAWALNVEILQGGCWLWRADLDRNGREDLILVTSDASSAGDSVATLILIDGQGRPVPWQANGYFDGDDGGLGNLVDLDRDGRAELLYLHVQGYDRGEAEATSISQYEIRDAHLTRIAGRFAGEMFPMIRPAGAQIRGEPDLTNAIGPAARRYSIASVIAGRKENCGVQVTLRRQPGGEVAVDATAAEAQAALCHDRLVLSDGTTVIMPEMVVIDGRGGCAVAIGDVASLIAKVKARRLAVQFAGRVCEDGRPFLLWATEPSTGTPPDAHPAHR